MKRKPSSHQLLRSRRSKKQKEHSLLQPGVSGLASFSYSRLQTRLAYPGNMPPRPCPPYFPGHAYRLDDVKPMREGGNPGGHPSPQHSFSRKRHPFQGPRAAQLWQRPLQSPRSCPSRHSSNAVRRRLTLAEAACPRPTAERLASPYPRRRCVANGRRAAARHRLPCVQEAERASLRRQPQQRALLLLLHQRAGQGSSPLPFPRCLRERGVPVPPASSAVQGAQASGAGVELGFPFQPRLPPSALEKRKWSLLSSRKLASAPQLGVGCGSHCSGVWGACPC